MHIAFKSDVGQNRTTNEDYVNWFTNSSNGFWINSLDDFTSIS